jgi:hypothetical protein
LRTFNEIVTTLRLADKERDWNDRRAYPRVPMQKCMAIIPYQAGVTGETANVWVRDISLGGVGLVHFAHMEQDDEFLIRLPQLNGHAVMLCRVSYCAPLSGETSKGLYGVGARFVRVMPEPHGQGEPRHDSSLAT